MSTDYEIVVGMEIHVEVETASKIFCGCSTDFGGEPNHQVCPVCLGLPGSLPVLNREALQRTLMVALALNCEVSRRSRFERKNYYYPDLPKNYQISQLRSNLGENGYMEIAVGEETLRVRMNNVHLEEDAGKSSHHAAMGSEYSLVDLNRAGTGLIEIVTEPDFRTVEEIQAFMISLRSLLRTLKVSDCNMHEGRLRFEANISVRPVGEETLGTKVEVKNLNSYKFVIQSVKHEARRQIKLLQAGGTVDQETRLWDDAAGCTQVMRSKEDAHDYRYFPDPDLPLMEISDAWIADIQAALPELPEARRKRFVADYKLEQSVADQLVAEFDLANLFEDAVRLHDNPVGIANWLIQQLALRLDADVVAHELLSAAHLAELVAMVDSNEISATIAKEVFSHVLGGEGSPREVVAKHSMAQISDEDSIGAVVDEVIAENEKAAEDVRQGKDKALGALVGQAMRKTKGRGDPQLLNKFFKDRLQS